MLRNRGWVVCLLLLVLGCGCGASAPHSAPDRAACADGERELFEPGCDGPPRGSCQQAVGTLPVVTQWCGCDGQTHESGSEAPPDGLRYRHAGTCEGGPVVGPVSACGVFHNECDPGCPSGQRCDMEGACTEANCVCDASGAWICTAECIAARCVPS